MFKFIMQMVDKVADSELLAKIETKVLSTYDTMCAKADKVTPTCNNMPPEAEEIVTGPKVEVKL
jgi:hypothetical protein